jgi:hypothetical protein
MSIIRKHTVFGHRLLHIDPSHPNRAQCSCGEYYDLKEETYKYQTKDKAREWHNEHKLNIRPIKDYIPSVTVRQLSSMPDYDLRQYWRTKQKESRAHRKIKLPDPPEQTHTS